MGLDELLARFEADVDTRVATLAADADARVAAIRAEGDVAVRQRRAERLGRRERAVRAEVQRELSGERLAARRAVLEARERLLQRVFEATERALSEADDTKAWLEGLPVEVDTALAYLGSVAAIVTCRPPLAEAVRAAVAERSVEVRPDPEAAAGLVVEAADGSVTVDATLAGRLEGLRPVLARAILDALGAPP